MRISDWSSDVCSSDLRYPGDRVAADAGGGDDHLCRSQDLGGDGVAPWPQRRRAAGAAPELRRRPEGVPPGNDHPIGGEQGTVPRSEEHTSELQSLMRISYAVFCLKKKNKKDTNIL